MQRRVLAAIAAVALAAVGAFLLVSYVTSADERARASEETVQVLVAQEVITRGTAANEIVVGVDAKLEDVPKRLLLVEDPLADLAELGTTPTSTGMLPGDLLTQGRFVADAATPKPRAGLEQVSVTLDAQRAVGGRLSEGDRVAVYRTGATDGLPVTERLFEDGVEVARVSDIDESGATGGVVTVTLFLTPEQASSVVAGMHNGAVWLSLIDTTTNKGN